MQSPLSTHRSAVRLPKQSRSRKTLDRILQATEALLKTHPFESLTLAEIARTAGVARGTLHAQFRTKVALLDHLHSEYCDWELGRTREVLTEIEARRLELGEAIELGTRAYVTSLRERRALAHVFLETAHHVRSIRTRRAATVRQQYLLVTTFLRREYVELLSPQASRRIERTVQLVVAAVRDALHYEDCYPLRPDDDEELIRTLVRLTLHRLSP